MNTTLAAAQAVAAAPVEPALTLLRPTIFSIDHAECAAPPHVQFVRLEEVQYTSSDLARSPAAPSLFTWTAHTLLAAYFLPDLMQRKIKMRLHSVYNGKARNAVEPSQNACF